MQGFIRTTNEKNEPCKATKNHAETLTKLGYEVKEDGDHVAISCSGFVTTEQDLSTPEKAQACLKEVITKKQLFTYSTRFRMPSGKTVYGTMGCGQLGKISALICKEAKAAPAKKAAVSAAMSSLLDGLL